MARLRRVRRRAAKKKVAKRVVRAHTVARRRRRAAFAAQPLPVRKAAAALLPKSRRQVGKKIGLKRREVIQLIQAASSASNTAERAQIQKQVEEEVKKLAGLVAVAHKKKKRAFSGGSAGVVQITPEQAKTRLAQVQANLAETEKGLKVLAAKQAVKKGPPAVLKKRRDRIQVLRIKKAKLLRRVLLLQKNLDFARPIKIHPSRVAIQRRPLGLPRAWAVPSAADTTVIIRLLGTQVKRLPGENDTLFLQRLRAFTQRALIRFVNTKTAGLESAAAVRQAVEATLVEDAPALNAEAEAGGVVIDPVAESMDTVIQPVAEQLETAAEDTQVEVPAGSPSPQEVDQVLQAAEEAEVDAAQAPPEPADEIADDLLFPEEPFEELDYEDVEIEVGEEEPLYKDPKVVLGVIGGLGLLWFLSGR